MNKGLFKSNSDVHIIQTRKKLDLHMPSSKITLFQKGVQYSGSMIFSHLPSGVKDLSNNEKSFKSALKNFLLANMFYMVDEFLAEKT
jgi:hypothetical protein